MVGLHASELMKNEGITTMELTLLVLAAGMGSRYGGLKQVEGVGPSGETLLEYNLYDALEAGFDRVVFVIREAIREDFVDRVCSRLPERVSYQLVFQELDTLPAGFDAFPERTKPWGTGHAVWCARNAVKGPFAMINADDLYGRASFDCLGEFLRKVPDGGALQAMVAYRLGLTLSEGGTVSRGLCERDGQGMLRGITEVHGIGRQLDGSIGYVGQGADVAHLPHDHPVSMNLFGFTPEVFEWTERALVSFLSNHGRDLKAECYIPAVIDEAIRDGRTSVRLLDTPDFWLGVTHPSDRQHVVDGIRQKVDSGFYPSPLWG